MAKSNNPLSAAPRLCPTCGTRVGAAATKCLVCGADLSASTAAATGRTAPATALSRQPISLTTVLIIVFVLVLLVAGGGLILAALDVVPALFGPEDTPTPTATQTVPPTITPSPTATETPVPSATPLPPVDYVIQSGDTCLKIATQFNVSVQSIVGANPGVIDPNCNILSVGVTIKVPQPTPTATPLPTATLAPGVATQAPRVTYTVRLGDTLAGIANFYGLTVPDLMEANGLTTPDIRAGQILIIPFEKIVTPGPTPTVTSPPPYPAPNLLVPENGQVFGAGEAITLQWTTVGQLRSNELYLVTIEDLTCNCARLLREAATETRFVVPATLQPNGTAIFRWNVTTVRLRAGTDPAQRQYEPAGAASPDRFFSWAGPP